MASPYLKSYGRFDVTPTDTTTQLYMVTPAEAEAGDVLIRVRLAAPLSTGENVSGGWVYAGAVAAGDAGVTPINAGSALAAGVGTTFPVWWWFLFGGTTAFSSKTGTTLTVPVVGVDSLYVEIAVGFAGTSANAADLVPRAGYTALAPVQCSGEYDYGQSYRYLGVLAAGKPAGTTTTDTLSAVYPGPYNSWGGGIYAGRAFALSGTASARGQSIAPTAGTATAAGAAIGITRTAHMTVAPAAGAVAAGGAAPIVTRGAVRAVALATAAWPDITATDLSIVAIAAAAWPGITATAAVQQAQATQC